MSDYVRRVRSRIGNEFLLMPSVTALVFDEERRVLLVRLSRRDVWVAPGGAVDPDEAPQDAVVREVWEETGLLVEPMQLRGVFGGPEYRAWYANGDEVGYMMAVYECRATGGSLRSRRRRNRGGALFFAGRAVVDHAVAMGADRCPRADGQRRAMAAARDLAAVD